MVIDAMPQVREINEFWSFVLAGPGCCRCSTHSLHGPVVVAAAPALAATGPSTASGPSTGAAVPADVAPAEVAALAPVARRVAVSALKTAEEPAADQLAAVACSPGSSGGGPATACPGPWWGWGSYYNR